MVLKKHEFAVWSARTSGNANVKPFKSIARPHPINPLLARIEVKSIWSLPRTSGNMPRKLPYPLSQSAEWNTFPSKRSRQSVRSSSHTSSGPCNAATAYTR